jgi:hypothetical protein
MKKHAAPIIAAILLLLPVLYVGSYLALVVPTGIPIQDKISAEWVATSYYRVGGTSSARFFWPLEQIDRRVRPNSWLRGLFNDHRSRQIEKSLGGNF